MATIATPTLVIEPDSDILLYPAPSIIVDWNNDGTFDSSEDIATYVTSMDWTRGKEPEQIGTPTGTAVIQISDPTGIFTPNSTFWGVNGTVTIGRGVRATITYQGSSYTVFRGVVQRISNVVRPGSDQRATIFCTDELEILKRRIITAPNTSVSTSTPTGAIPLLDKTFGNSTDGSTSIITHILNEAGWSTARRAINEVGSTASFWWVYRESALDALHEVERHEGRRSIVFINSSGDLTFYSSTHNNGVAHVASFGPGSTGPLVNLIQGQLSARNVVNRSIATIFTRKTGALNSTQEITFPATAIVVGDTFSWVSKFDNDPISGILGITAQVDSSAGLAIVGVTSGTSYGTSVNADMVKYQVLGGGTAIQYFITNPSTESVQVTRPETWSGSTDVFPQVYAKLPPTAFETTFADPTSTGIYGSREVQAEYPFFGTQPKAVLRAAQDVANNSTAHMEGMSLSLTGSDSNSVRQILTRGIFDRIRVTSTEMHFKHVDAGGTTLNVGDFYITKGDWTLDAGGLLGAVWTIDESTKAST